MTNTKDPQPDNSDSNYPEKPLSSDRAYVYMGFIETYVPEDLWESAEKALGEYVREAEIEARIEEIKHLDDEYQENSQDWERDHPGYSTSMVPIEDYTRRRKELEAELQRLQKENQ